MLLGRLLQHSPLLKSHRCHTLTRSSATAAFGQRRHGPVRCQRGLVCSPSVTGKIGSSLPEATTYRKSMSSNRVALITFFPFLIPRLRLSSSSALSFWSSGYGGGCVIPCATLREGGWGG